MILPIARGHVRRYLKEQGHPARFLLSVPNAEIARHEQEIRNQHPEEEHPRERAIARMVALKYRKTNKRLDWWKALVILLLVLILALQLRAQNPNVNIDRVGGTKVTTSIPITCLAGCGAAPGTSDVNLLQFLGVTPSNTNPIPMQLSNGVAYYDSRDRNWALGSATDSVTIVGSISNTTFAATQGTSPWVVSGAVTTGGLTDAELRATPVPISGAISFTAPQHVIADSGTIDTITNPVAVTGTFFQATQPVSGTFFQATQPVSGTFWPTTAAAPLSGRLSDGAAFYDATKTGQLPAALDGSGFLKTHEQGTATVTGTVTANATLAAETTKIIGEVIPVTTATTTDTASRCTLVSAASTNATNCKNAAGNVYGFRFINTTATLYYLRMYNLSSSPTCSSATGFIESIPIPASATGGGIVAIEPFGEGYTTGISFCFTGGSSSTDNTNAATGVFGTILYK